MTALDQRAFTAREKAKERVRKLRNMTARRGCSPVEAAKAAQLAAKMMRRYGLTEKELAEPPPPPRPVIYATSTGKSRVDPFDPWEEVPEPAPRAGEEWEEVPEPAPRPKPKPVPQPEPEPPPNVAYTVWREKAPTPRGVRRAVKLPRLPGFLRGPGLWWRVPLLAYSTLTVLLNAYNVVVLVHFDLSNPYNKYITPQVEWQALECLLYLCLGLAGMAVTAPSVGPVLWKHIRALFRWNAAPVDDPSALVRRAGLFTDKGLILGLIPWKLEPVGQVVRWVLHLVGYDGDRHIVLFGPTGSGKNLTIQTPLILQCPRSGLYVDVKGQLWSLCREQLRHRFGHRVLVLNPYDVLGVPSATFNPLSRLDPGALSFMSDVRRIAESLVPVGDGDGRFFSVSALDYAAILIGWVVLKKGDTGFPYRAGTGGVAAPDMSLNRVFELLCLSDKERGKLMELICACGYKPIAQAAARYTATDSKEVRDCVQTARVEFGVLNDPAISRVLCSGPKEIRFADLKKRRQSVFVMIPPEKLAEAGAGGKFLRLVTMSALGELIAHSTSSGHPFHEHPAGHSMNIRPPS